MRILLTCTLTNKSTTLCKTGKLTFTTHMQYLNNTQNQVINEKNTTAWYLIAK